jgi:hypothetical protein
MRFRSAAAHDRSGIGPGERVVAALPWLSLGLGVAYATAVLLGWPRLSAVDRVSLASDAVIALAAVSALRARRRLGWVLLFAGTELQIGYGVAGLAFGAFGGPVGFVGRVVGVVATLAALWPLRSRYPSRRAQLI